MAGDTPGEVVVPPTLQTLPLRDWISSRPASGRCSSGVRSRARSSTAARSRHSHLPTFQVTPRRARCGADPAGEDAAFRRGRLPLPPPLDPRRGLRGAAEGGTSRTDERFALWLEEHGAELVELDEIVGYHLEQSWLYRAEPGLDDGVLAAVARRRLPPRRARPIAGRQRRRRESAWSAPPRSFPRTRSMSAWSTTWLRIALVGRDW